MRFGGRKKMLRKKNRINFSILRLRYAVSIAVMRRKRKKGAKNESLGYNNVTDPNLAPFTRLHLAFMAEQGQRGRDSHISRKKFHPDPETTFSRWYAYIYTCVYSEWKQALSLLHSCRLFFAPRSTKGLFCTVRPSTGMRMTPFLQLE